MNSVVVKPTFCNKKRCVKDYLYSWKLNKFKYKLEPSPTFPLAPRQDEQYKEPSFSKSLSTSTWLLSCTNRVSWTVDSFIFFLKHESYGNCALLLYRTTEHKTLAYLGRVIPLRELFTLLHWVTTRWLTISYWCGCLEWLHLVKVVANKEVRDLKSGNE